MKRHKGLISVEFVVALGVLTIIVGVLISLGNSFGRLNNNLWTRHTCYTAGQAQMDSLTVTGKQIDAEKFKSLWPDVTCRIETSQGTGQWQGLNKVQLFLSTIVKEKDIHIEMMAYLSEDKGESHEN